MTNPPLDHAALRKLAEEANYQAAYSRVEWWIERVPPSVVLALLGRIAELEQENAILAGDLSEAARYAER